MAVCSNSYPPIIHFLKCNIVLKILYFNSYGYTETIDFFRFIRFSREEIKIRADYIIISAITKSKLILKI